MWRSVLRRYLVIFVTIIFMLIVDVSEVVPVLAIISYVFTYFFIIFSFLLIYAFLDISFFVVFKTRSQRYVAQLFHPFVNYCNYLGPAFTAPLLVKKHFFYFFY